MNFTRKTSVEFLRLPWQLLIRAFLWLPRNSSNRMKAGQRKWKHANFFIFIFFYFTLFYFTILYWFCHTSSWICRRCTRVAHPEPPSHFLPHTIPLGHSSAPALSILYHASNLDWRFVSYMILYVFQCHSPKSSHPLLPQSAKDCSIHLCLFCCLTYRVIVTIFLNSIYMC